MTGQVYFDSYADTGVVVGAELVNELVRTPGAEATKRAHLLPTLARILARDPPSVSQLRESDVPGFLFLARALSDVFAHRQRGDLDAAALRLNDLLARHPAHPHLAKEDGRWRLHHHPAAMALVPMWTAICAEALARMLGAGHADRFGTCDAPDCERVFFDVSKNGSRRFCSTTCQNRVKAAAFRRRQSAGTRRGGARRPGLR